MPNSIHVSTGIEPLSLNIVFNRNPYNIETNELTHIADQWASFQRHEFLLKGTLEQKINKAFPWDKGRKLN